MPRIYIGIGSNCGPRARNIRRGLQLLAEKGFRILKHSPVYETLPVNMPGARRFLNSVVAAETNQPARDGLGRLRAIERELGRPARHLRNVPRTLDLDLLLYGRAIIRERGLAVPHPGLPDRAFVLVPLADIAPKLVHPVLRRRISTLLKHVNRKGVRRWTAH